MIVILREVNIASKYFFYHHNLDKGRLLPKNLVDE